MPLICNSYFQVLFRVVKIERVTSEKEAVTELKEPQQRLWLSLALDVCHVSRLKAQAASASRLSFFRIVFVESVSM